MQRTRVGAVRQWAVLTQRAYETLAHNPLTLAILIGSPILVIAMVAVLFRAGAFGEADPSPTAALMILFWVAFGAFFFGLTYGLLMICTEVPIFHRERLVNLRVVPYVLSKIALLIPVLVVVVLVMVGVLRLTHRLPAAGMEVYVPLITTLLLDGIAAIALGLLASAAVTRPEQATLALPMLCYPQVLFSGAILPVPVMAGAGKALSWTATDKYAFNALGKSVDINSRFADSASPLGPSLLAQYGGTFSGSVMPDWAIMGGVTILLLALTCWVLSRKSPTLVR
jgi:ABC-type multidrug transport system permease subunit